jgi:hypothetical protein
VNTLNFKAQKKEGNERNLTESDAHVQLQRAKRLKAKSLKDFFLIIIQLFSFSIQERRKKEQRREKAFP